jgi:hypothetical protein
VSSQGSSSYLIQNGSNRVPGQLTDRALRGACDLGYDGDCESVRDGALRGRYRIPVPCHRGRGIG